MKRNRGIGGTPLVLVASITLFGSALAGCGSTGSDVPNAARTAPTTAAVIPTAESAPTSRPPDTATSPAIPTAAAPATLPAAATPVGATPASSHGTFVNPRNGHAFAVTRVVTDTQGGLVAKPDPGKMYLMLDVVATNNSANNQVWSPNILDIKVIDNNERTWSETSFFPADKYEGFGIPMLSPGDNHSGWVGYEVPVGTTSVVVTWSDSGELVPPAVLGRYRLSR